MRFAIIDLLVLASIIGGLYVLYRTWASNQAAKLLTKTAYFSGGPLNASEEKLAKLPASIHHVYDKPRMIKLVEGSAPVPVQTWYEAIYTHQGQGVYEYQGSTPVNKELEYDTNDS
jgi:hypothetical protein